MNLREVKYFIQLAEDKNYTRAASNLAISQPALSKAIKLLELDLGIDLVDRSCNKRFNLTSEGKIFYENAKVTLKNIDDEISILKDCIKRCKNDLIVAIPPVMGIIYFTSVIAGFKKKYNNINIKIIEDGSNEIQQKVLDQECDLGIIVTTCNNLNVKNVPITKEEVSIVVYKEHPFFKKEEVEVEDLKDEKIISLNSKFHLKKKIISICRKYDFEPNITTESSQWYFIMQMVVFEEGIGILPEKIIDRFKTDKLKKIKIKENPIQLNINCIYNLDKRLNTPSQLFINYLNDLENA